MKKAVLSFISLALAFALTACRQLDVVGKKSITSFEAVLSAMGDNVAADDIHGGWSLKAPDGTVRFIWSKDYSESPLYDVMLEYDAKPFLDAGLDTGKLPDTIFFREGKLTVGSKLGSDELIYSGDITPLASYEQIVNKYRKSVSYHTALDHFNVDLGGGNMFEWAKDTTINAATDSAQDKDIVFVLDPAVFIVAGVDLNKVEGWTFAKVTADIDGKPTHADKFLKPFDIRQ